MSNETLSDDSADSENIFADKNNNFFHRGKVSNYRKEVVSHTSGEISISGVRSLPSGHIEGGGGGGSVSTTHYHTMYFDIGNKSFAWSGNNPLSDGDEVALCSTPMANGYNQVECLKNITKGLFFKKNYREDGAYIACGKKIEWAIGIGGFSLFSMGWLIERGFVIASLLPITVLVISGLALISIIKARREIINSVKIINNAVLECE